MSGKECATTVIARMKISSFISVQAGLARKILSANQAIANITTALYQKLISASALKKHQRDVAGVQKQLALAESSASTSDASLISQIPCSQ
jgi:hypothetical protein